MASLLATVDALLRGRLTTRERLEAGHVDAQARTLAVVGLLLGMIYGVGMGAYGALRPENPAWSQVLASAVKVPLLFLLTLVVTFPSLYVGGGTPTLCLDGLEPLLGRLDVDGERAIEVLPMVRS